MATTKVVRAMFTAETITAGAADETSSVAAVDDGYGCAAHVKVTNAGTPPTVPCQVQMQVSPDNSEWYDFGGPLVAGTVASTAYGWGGIEIPIGVEYVRCKAGSNTGQDVTVEAELSEVTEIS